MHRFSFDCLALCALLATLAAAADTTLHIGRVVGVTDGDTLTLLSGRKQIKVRLADIDAPERKQPFGRRAGETLSALAFDKQARVVEVDTDRYGRLVGRVYVGAVDVNAELVRQGMAWVYRKYAKDPALYEFERTARAKRRGLWHDTEPVPPWEWRSAKRK